MRTNAPLKSTFFNPIRYSARVAAIVASLLFAGHLSATPEVSVVVSPSPITSAFEDAVFTVTLSAPTPRGAAIAFFMSGAAKAASDYVLLGNFDGKGRILIPAGETSATVTLHTLFRDPSLPLLDATMNLGHGSHYRLGSPRRAQLLIELP